MNIQGPELLMLLLIAAVFLAIIGVVVFVIVKLATRSKQ